MYNQLMGSRHNRKNQSRDRSRHLTRYRKRSYSGSSYERKERKHDRSTRHTKHRRHDTHDRHDRRDRHGRDHSRKRRQSYSASYSKNSYSSRSQSQSISSKSSSKHYDFRIGEYLGKSYKVTKLLGDGTFGRVVEAQKDRKTYAVKIIKSVARYIDSAKTQKNIVKFMNNKDPQDKQGLLRYVESFDHYKNYCLVFKPLGKSLYSVLKMNDYKGFPLNLVQSFFKQMLQTVGFIHSVGYTHTDLKPENVLLEKNEFRKEQYPTKDKEKQWISLPLDDKIRVIDFGGATADNEHHSKIINTRQYRSPEVIMGSCKWDQVSDVWSIGCIVIQLYTGDLYFSTHNDIEHLRMIEKHNGSPMPQWMSSQSEQYRKYFHNGALDWPRVAPSRQSVRSVEDMSVLQQIMKPHQALQDLLMRCLQVNPRKRITCSDGLKHRFFSMSC